MKYKFAAIFTVLSAILILSQFGAWNALLLLFLVGAVPGTTLTLSPQIMFVSFVVMMILGTLFFVQPLKPKTPQQSLPRRRYSRI